MSKVKILELPCMSCGRNMFDGRDPKSAYYCRVCRDAIVAGKIEKVVKAAPVMHCGCGVYLEEWDRPQGKCGECMGIFKEETAHSGAAFPVSESMRSYWSKKAYAKQRHWARVRNEAEKEGVYDEARKG